MKKILFTLLIVFCVQNISAQTVDDVTLVVSGDGPTKEEATHVALRSAIEQAYGVFVSANTEILNDEMIKDEIATVTSGNVKSYNELSAAVLPNGNHLVSLQAVVSTKKLIAYAQSKGASCEFAGALFGANLKLYELNKKNTEIAFENLIKQAKALAPYLYNPVLEMGTPRRNRSNNYDISFNIKLYSTPNTDEFINLIYSTFEALNINGEQISNLNRMNLYYSTVVLYPTEQNDSGEWNKIRAGYESSSYIKSRMNFYADFPHKLFFKEVYNSLPKYSCILDNFDNKYYYNIRLYDKIVRLYDNINKCLIQLDETVGYNSSNLNFVFGFFYEYDEIYLPKNEKENEKSFLEIFFGVKKQNKKQAKKEFIPKYLMSYKGEITISEEDLVKISNFRLMELTEEQDELMNLNDAILEVGYQGNQINVPYVVEKIFANNLDVDDAISFFKAELKYLKLNTNKENYQRDLKCLLAEIYYKRKDYESACYFYNEMGTSWINSCYDKSFWEHYFNCVNHVLDNNKPLIPIIPIEFIKNIIFCSAEYTTEMLKKIDKLISNDTEIDYKELDAYLHMYYTLRKLEPQNKEWKTKYDYYYKKYKQ